MLCSTLPTFSVPSEFAACNCHFKGGLIPFSAAPSAHGSPTSSNTKLILVTAELTSSMLSPCKTCSPGTSYDLKPNSVFNK